MTRFSNLVACGVLIVMAVTATATPFERDTHYYATFALALTACFDWEEAHLIASADVMVDGNHATVAELVPTKRHNKAAWHAFGHSIERYYELWDRVLLEEREELRLIAFGQFLHFLQDWEAHAGYPVHLGHAKATVLGHDPDSMARSEARTRHAVQATVDHMSLLCRELGRLPKGIEDSDQAVASYLDVVVGERLVRDLIDASDPRWRTTVSGELTKHGTDVMSDNVLRIERYLDERIARLSDTKVPAGFQPGSDAFGIPEPLELDFDADGALTSDLELHLQRAGRHPENDHLDPADHSIRVVHAEPTKRGWKVRVEVTNSGDVVMPPGDLVAVAVDALAEEQLGETSERVPEMAAHESRTLKLKIPTSRPTETALIGVSFASTFDRDRHNSDIWHTTAEDLDELEAHVAAYGHLHGMSTIPDDASLEIVAPPRLWLAAGGRLCVTNVARGTSTDPSIHVEPPTFTLGRTQPDRIELVSAVPNVWTITPLHPGEVPAVKSFACFDLTDELCSEVETVSGEHRFEVSIGLGEVRRSSSVEVGPEISDGVRRACRERLVSDGAAGPRSS